MLFKCTFIPKYYGTKIFEWIFTRQSATLIVSQVSHETGISGWNLNNKNMDCQARQIVICENQLNAVICVDVVVCWMMTITNLWQKKRLPSVHADYTMLVPSGPSVKSTYVPNSGVLVVKYKQNVWVVDISGSIWPSVTFQYLRVEMLIRGPFERLWLLCSDFRHKYLDWAMTVFHIALYK